MAISEAQTGTTTCSTLGTEQTLGAQVTTAGLYELVLDTTNLTGTEELALRVLANIGAASATEKEVDSVTLTANASRPILALIPFTVAGTATLKVTQNNGTLRAFDWSVRKLA